MTGKKRLRAAYKAEKAVDNVQDASDELKND